MKSKLKIRMMPLQEYTDTINALGSKVAFVEVKFDSGNKMDGFYAIKD